MTEENKIFGYIEDPNELNLKLDELDFEAITDLSNEILENEKVHDLEVENNHNYVVEGLGLVHNGGGK